MRKIKFHYVYLFFLFLAVSGMLPPAVSDAMILVLLSTAPIMIMYYLVNSIPAETKKTCPPHSYVKGKDEVLICSKCSYKPRDHSGGN